jgi:integrase
VAPKRGTVSEDANASGEQCINAPKSGKFRLVDMSQQLCEILQGYIEAMRPKLWLFPGKDILPIHPTTFREYWLKIMTYAGLPYRKPHALRHTYASLLIAQGEHPMYIRDQLGHSSIKITIDTYGHLMRPGKQTAVDRLDDPTIRNPYATRGLRLVGSG